MLLEALHPRFQRFVRFALGTGCRLDEIRGIEPTRDIDWLRGTVHVIGKFRKERDVPMQPDARPRSRSSSRRTANCGSRIRSGYARCWPKARRARRSRRITPHALRHTFGTRWLQAGGDIYKLSKILGHSSVAVTEAHYAHLLKDDLVAASRQITLPIAERRNSVSCRSPCVMAPAGVEGYAGTST